MGEANFSSDDVFAGAANLLYAPLGTLLPDETTVAVNDFDSWPDGWVHLGYTAEGPSFTYSYETFEIEAQQATAPLRRKKTSETATITANLLQFSAEHLALVTGGTVTETVAGAAQKGYKKVVGGGEVDLTEYMFAIESTRADEDSELQPFRFFLWKGTITANGDINFAKDAATSLPITIAGLTDADKPIGEQLFEAHYVLSDVTP
jgi:hypothetical protein